jgi:hypothetical protein
MNAKIQSTNGIIPAIKAVRFLTGWGLSESKNYVEKNSDVTGNVYKVEVETTKTTENIQQFEKENPGRIIITLIEPTVDTTVKMEYAGNLVVVEIKSDKLNATFKAISEKGIEATKWLLENLA